MNKTTIHKDYLKAGAPDASEADLESLSVSPLPAVRRRVAEHAKTPVETLTKLSSDSNNDVRIAVGLNKKTPETILERLIHDESPDVRHWLASTSYLPKRFLDQLAIDTNPHVAHRAKRMLAGLGDRTDRIVSIFEVLTEDHGEVASNLETLIQNYSNWSHQKVLDETVDVLDAIRRHLERQRIFCLDYMESVDKELARTDSAFKKCVVDQEQIVGHISALLMQDIEDNSFQKNLSELSERIKRHIELSENELFAEMKKHVPQKELDEINARVKEALLRGKEAAAQHLPH